MSIIPADDPCRGCLSRFVHPLQPENLNEAQNLYETLNRVNVNEGNLTEIVYRTGERNRDITRPVYRWDRRSYEEIFINGFQARPQGETPNSTYYNLLNFVNHAGAPLDNTPSAATYVFVSTTLNHGVERWHPIPYLRQGSSIQIYYYEIYAPGGVWVSVTLRNRYEHRSQNEVCFVGGISPQYIRSCIEYTITRLERSVLRLQSQRLIINNNFNPMSIPHVTNARLEIILPIDQIIRDEDNRRRVLSQHQLERLREETYPPRRRRREVLDAADDDAYEWYEEEEEKNDAYEWYTTKVLEVQSYIDSAFRSSRTNEVYFFFKNTYVRVYYIPGRTDDEILTDVSLISEGFPSLSDTPFGEYGFDCAFDTEDSKAYIFSTNLCAYIDYAPGTLDDKILSGPMTIAAMFPVLKNTVFQNGIDSAFRSTKGKEVYLFKDNKYARIDYDSKELIGTIRNISDGFPVLKGTIFESGIDACFASHKEGLAYLFKGENYGRINFTPGKTDDTLVGDVKPIFNGWPILRGILPRDNRGFGHDFRFDEPSDPPQHDEPSHPPHDEL